MLFRDAGSTPAISTIFEVVGPETVPFSTVSGFCVLRNLFFRLDPAFVVGIKENSLFDGL